MHELRARMTAVPGEADAQRGGRRDGRHNAQRRAVRLQLWALLNVQLRKAKARAHTTPKKSSGSLQYTFVTWGATMASMRSGSTPFGTALSG